MTNKNAEIAKNDRFATCNADPITDEPGAHPLGVGVGAAVTGAIGGIGGGTAGGPIGALVGVVTGAIVGGLSGKEVAESIEPTDEEAYWRANYSNRAYFNPQIDFEEYAPAYRYGKKSRIKYPARQFDDVEGELSRNWDAARAESRLSWEKAKVAVREAWDQGLKSPENQVKPTA